ncbi:MAG: hypothetical protein NTV29_01595 [Planctomycetota bacterium]|nr:hypothetical protein [Planctomycetota bacterium]
MTAQALEGSVRIIQCPEGAKPVRALQGAGGGVYAIADSDNGPVCFHSADYGVSFSKPIPLVDGASVQPGLEFHVWDTAMGHSGKLFVALTKKAVSKTPWVLDTCPMTYYSLTATSSGMTAAWPTQREVYVAKISKDGRLQSPGEVKTTGLSGMRTGLLTIQNIKDETLVVWNSDNQIGWQVFGNAMQPTSSTGSIPTTGKGVAGFLDADGAFVLLY